MRIAESAPSASGTRDHVEPPADKMISLRLDARRSRYGEHRHHPALVAHAVPWSMRRKPPPPPPPGSCGARRAAHPAASPTSVGPRSRYPKMSFNGSYCIIQTYGRSSAFNSAGILVFMTGTEFGCPLGPSACECSNGRGVDDRAGRRLHAKLATALNGVGAAVPCAVVVPRWDRPSTSLPLNSRGSASAALLLCSACNGCAGDPPSRQAEALHD